MFLPHRTTSTATTSLSLLLALAASFAAALPAAGQEQTAAPAPQVSTAQIDRWIAELNDDRFDKRQNAQQQLVQARPVPIEEIAAAAQQGSLESTTRALNILIQWSESKEDSLRLASLHKLADMTDRPREASMASRLLGDYRETVAIAALAEHGAYVNDAFVGGIANRVIMLDKNWTGGDEALKHLKDVRRVVILKLHSAPVTDAGLVYLEDLAEVRKIELFGIRASKTAMNKLADRYPPRTVDVRSGALLGVSGDINRNSEVTSVVKDSAAFKAGIIAGDRITAINGSEVKDFEQLTRKIADFQPGDTVTLTIQRNENELKLKATFDQWGADENVRKAAQQMNNIRVLRAAQPNQIPQPQPKVIPR